MTFSTQSYARIVLRQGDSVSVDEREIKSRDIKEIIKMIPARDRDKLVTVFCFDADITNINGQDFVGKDRKNTQSFRVGTVLTKAEVEADAFLSDKDRVSFAFIFGYSARIQDAVPEALLLHNDGGGTLHKTDIIIDKEGNQLWPKKAATPGTKAGATTPQNGALNL